MSTDSAPLYNWKHNNVVCLLDSQLVIIAEKKKCTGSEISIGKLKTISLCHEACKGKATMFVYGLYPSRCDKDGCDCFCETSSKDGGCATQDHLGFNLYAVKEYAKVVKQG